MLKKIGNWFINYWHKFAHVGLFIAIIFTAFSLTPSLLPRSPIYQGLLSGVVFAFGYGIGTFLLYLWHYLQLPALKKSWRKNVHIGFAVIAIAVVIYAIGNWVKWQNSILEVMNQELISNNFVSFLVIFVGIIVAMLLIAIGRLILKWFHFVIKKIHKFVPLRISYFIGFTLAFFLFIVLLNGVLIQGLFGIVDSASSKVNSLTDNDEQMPTDSFKTGSSDSLIEWDTLGRTGRNFISTGPTAQEISEFTGEPALEPLRVYAGLESRKTPQERADLALEELKRINAFDRGTLIISTPTGTGWMDPYAVDTIEYMLGGDTANVTSQYSYMSSQATLVFDPEKAGDEAEALFGTVYDHWKTLPKDSRPKLYLWGLSLGAFGSEKSAKLHEIMEDPFDGALWTGPPFVNKLHKEIVKDRNSESPQWLPTYEEGSLVQFTSNNIDKSLDPIVPWGDVRFLYLQDASDPMVFFSMDLFHKHPDWLKEKRGPDVSPFLQWYPMVTFFQIAFDLIVSVSAAPLGHGHNYSPVDYIDNWSILMDLPNWTDEMSTQLKQKFLE